MYGQVLGTVFQIQRFSVHDGDGLRTTVFFKGCPLHCKWCHNPEGLTAKKQLAFLTEQCICCGGCAAVCPNGVHQITPELGHQVDRSRCIYCGQCEHVCPAAALKIIGQVMTAREVVDQVLRDRPFYREEGGITCSGGECTMQPEFLLAVLALSHQEGLTTAVDTCGFAPRRVFEDILPFADMFLYDIKTITPSLHHAYTGADNKVIHENYRMLHAAGARLDVRIPLIPGVNDSWEEIERIGAFLLEAGIPHAVKVIPYHTPGKGKHAQLGLPLWTPPDQGHLSAEEAQQMLKAMLYEEPRRS